MAKNIKTKRTNQKRKDTLEEAQPRPEYININEVTPEMATKYRVLWLVAIIGIVVLAVAWLFSVRANVGKIANEIQQWQLENATKASADKIQDTLTEEQSQASSTAASQELALIKDQVISQIKNNLDNSNWPTYISTLGLTLQYPDSWYKKDGSNLLSLSSYNSSSATPETFGQITILKKTNAQKLSLAKWVDKIAALKAGDYILDQSDLKVAGQKAIKYTKVENKNFSWLIYLAYENYVYEINVTSKNGQNLYEPVFNQMISSIKLEAVK